MHRENNFDAVRLLAAATVIFGHAHPLTGEASPALLGNSVQALAVKIFFVISGYLIYTSWSLDPSVTRYLRKRALRIFPALIAICVLSVFVIGPLLTSLPLRTYFGYAHTYAYFRNVALFPIYDLPGLFADNVYPIAVNGSFWSLPIEFAMYLILPLVLVFGRLLRLRHLLLVATVVLCALNLEFVRLSPPVAHPVFYGSDLISALDVAPYFLLGATCKAYGLDRLLNPVIALFMAMLVALVHPGSALGSEAILFVLLPYCTLSLAVSLHPLLSRAGRYGDFSYGLYLYGFLVQQAVAQLTHNGLPAMFNAGISLPIALAFAWCSWRYVEKPMLSLKPRPRRIPIKAVAEEPL